MTEAVKNPEGLLRTAIHSSGMPFAAIARGAGVPQPCVSRFANGHTTLTLANAAKLFEYFGFKIVRQGNE